MKNKDPEFEELRSMLEQDETALPASLSREAVTAKLQEAQIKQKKKKIKVFPRVLAAAAAAAVVITSVTLIPWHKSVHTVPVTPQSETDTTDTTPISVSETGVLSRFSSEADLKAYFNNLYEDRKSETSWITYGVRKAASSGFAVEDAAADGSVTVAVNESISQTTARSNDTGNYGKTNTRTENVDEADVIKNDGRYLYIAHGGRISIVDTQTMERVYQSSVKPKEKNAQYRITSLYVQQNRLIATGTLYENMPDDAETKVGAYSYWRYGYYYGMGSKTVTLVFDITDRSSPALLRTAVQDGRPEQSRMVGSVLYTVTTYDVNVYNKETVKTAYAPAVNGKQISCSDIYVRDPKDDCTSYIVLTALDTADANSEIQKISMLGRSDELYCTTDTLYVLQSVYDWDSVYTNNKNHTEIYAFSLNKTALSLKASGSVPGTIDNQYAIDQNGGFLRVTTTDYDYARDVDISALYVLDGSLQIVGKLHDFAPDEQVKSTRFLGDLAYVVTFRNTDPLFAIDLSDPTAPKILGKVKLPGFSEYLHPLSDTLLLGVGYSGGDEELSEEDNYVSADYSSVKLSLFDISDPTAPKELDKRIIKQAGTDVNYDAKAFVFDSERGVFGLPVRYELYDQNGDWHGIRYVYKTYGVDNGKFTDEKAYLAESGKGDRYGYDDLFRGTYIEEKVYTVSGSVVREFDRASCEMLRSVEYDEIEQPEVDIYVKNDDAEIEEDVKYDETPLTEKTVTLPFDEEEAVEPSTIPHIETTVSGE